MSELGSEKTVGGGMYVRVLVHDRLVHNGDWQIIISDDHHPHVIPPEWIDPKRQPIRNTYWHPHWQPKPQP
jgi:hypothetical protein